MTKAKPKAAVPEEEHGAHFTAAQAEIGVEPEDAAEHYIEPEPTEDQS